MKLNFVKYGLISFILFLLGSEAFAQWEITEDEQFFRVRVWRRIDLRDKQNKGFFAYNREVTKFIMEGIESGELRVFDKSTNYKEEIPGEDFMINMLKTEKIVAEDWDSQINYASRMYARASDGKVYQANFDDIFGVDPVTDGGFSWTLIEEKDLEADVFTAGEMGIINVVEDVIFDKRRSRLYYDIEYVDLIIPGDKMAAANRGAEDAYFGSVSYDELEKLLRANPEARWVNRYNPKEWKNFADAFLLRLFTGPIIKYENPDDLDIAQIFTEHYDAVLEMVRFEFNLMEKEHNLWEY